MDILSTLSPMDPSEIPDRLKKIGKSQSDLARFLRLDPSSLSKTIRGDRQLKASEMLKIEAFLAGEVDEGPPPIESLATRRRTAPRRIPVYGYAAGGGADRVAFASAQIIEWIDPPPGWPANGEYFGVRVTGESMEPRFFSGETAIAQYGLPPAQGGDVVVEMRDDTALLKTYKGQRDGKVFLHQWNPNEDVAPIEGASVRALHAVVWAKR